MGRGPVGLRAELVDFLHRRKADLAARLGRPVELCTEHARIHRQIAVQEASREVFPNLLASRFYGEEQTILLHHEPASLYELDDVWVVGEDGVVFFDMGHALGVCHHVRGKFPGKARRPIRSLAARQAEPVFVLRGRSCENRAHFLLEHLPRFVSARRFLDEAGGVKLLLSPGHRSWQRGLLEKLGVHASQLVEESIGTTFCAKAYYVPLLTSDNSRILGPSALYHELAQQLAGGAPPVKREGVLFVSRNDAPERRLANEREVVALYEEIFGAVEVVRMSELAPAEQVERFRRAAIVTGAHGQGLRNVLFASGALFVQLCEGARLREDRRSAWESAFACLALMRGNRAINLYSETDLDARGSWHFPARRLRASLERIRELDART